MPSNETPPNANANDAPLRIVVEGAPQLVPRSTEVHALLPDHPPGSLGEPLAAIYNNRPVSLSYPVRGQGTLRWSTLADRQGWDVYRRSACLMLNEAARQWDPSLRLVVHQTHGDGLYFDSRDPERTLGREECRALESTMKAIQRADLPFVVRRVSVEEARALLHRQDQETKLYLLRTHWETTVRIVSLGGFVDLFHYPVAYSSGVIRSFRVVPYDRGLLLRLPVRRSRRVRGRTQVSRKLFETHQRTRTWLQLLGVCNLGQLNELSVKGRIDEIIRVAEGVQEKELAQIADEISARAGRVRLVLVAGPSASGKTTFVQRLAVQLRVNGLHPVALSVDNFFVDRDRTPTDEEGHLDFECLEALDLKAFNRVLDNLLQKGRAQVPRFDFTSGRRRPRDQWTELTLEKDQIILVEGIHALNPALTPAVAARQKYRIYVSALTQLAIDDHNRIFTSDTRLLRRIVRDRRYRGYSAADTLRRWPAVRRGEMRHIFPFQDHADVMFNSALVYEHAVLRPYAERYLLDIDERDDVFPEAYRLLGFLRLIVPIFRDDVPHNSILREFVGESTFDY